MASGILYLRKPILNNYTLRQFPNCDGVYKREVSDATWKHRKRNLIYIECFGKAETPKLRRDSWIDRKVHGKGGRQKRAFTEQGNQ